EECVTVRLSMDQAAKTRGEVRARKLCLEVLTDIRFRQVFERYLDAKLMDQQILLEHPQWAFGDDDIGRAVRTEQDELRRRTPASQRRDDVEGGEVNPVKVLQDEDERLVDGDMLQRLAHLADHALPRGSDSLAMQRLACLGLHQRRKQDEPG